jgi:DNA-binding MarR family transcriptional regulator
METNLYRELKQNKPFERMEEMTLINIARTSAWLSHRQEQFFKGWDLTGVQYNVLRILRGAGDEGRACQEIGERMVTFDSDVTRLLDRMEKRGWVKRERDTHDRRVVKVWITAAGKKLLEKIDAPLQEEITKLIGKLSKEKMKVLNESLEAIRAVE